MCLTRSILFLRNVYETDGTDILRLEGIFSENDSLTFYLYDIEKQISKEKEK